jgi:vitamin K-dependent gamma-carboxylase-like protein
VPARGLLRRADGWIFAAGDARRLAAVRIGLCGLLAVRLATTDYAAVARGPASLYQPLSYMKLFEHMPSPAVATTLQACGVAAAVLAAGGLALRLTLPVAFGCSLVLNGMLNSSGRVIVGVAVMMLCLLVLVACGDAAADAWSLRGLAQRNRATTRAARGARYGWPVRTMMIAVAFAYFFAGFQKWRYSGLPWVTSDNLRWILLGQAHPDGLALFVADRPWLAHVFAAGALLLETCFPLVLFMPRLRWVLIPAAVSMHVGVQLTIGLDYSPQWLTAVIVFVDWPVAVAWLRDVIAPSPALREAPR